MFELLGQLIRLPITAFVFGMEMLVKTLQGWQEIADRGLITIVAEVSDARESLPEARSDPQGDESETDDSVEDGAESKPKEESQMSENSLNNDKVKVVEYTILSIKPDHERVLDIPPDKNDPSKKGHTFPKVRVFSDNMTGEDFASWVIAEYFQEHPGVLDPKDKKYVRVCYDVKCTFEPEDAHYDKEEVDVLREIRDAIKEKKSGPTKP
jgi:hypothetical protein